MTKCCVFVDKHHLEKLDIQIQKALAIERNISTITMLNTKTVSKTIESQHLIDNEALGKFEQKAEDVWVITSTMEFDVGDLQKAVAFNLNKGKQYVYFTPHEKSIVFYNELFKKNLKEFQHIFHKYLNKQITINSFHLDFNYYFKEIIIYDALSDNPFGFTYITNRNNDEFELIMIPDSYLKGIIGVLS